MYLSFLVFADNPIEENQPDFERLVEETCQISPTPVFNKKRKAKRLVLQGPPVQYSEEEDPNTPSNQMNMEAEIEIMAQKREEKERSRVEQNTHKEVPYPKGKSQKCL
ncbi:hypothetical protein O181_121243 [Austropuccinia psidii MF-1]|uniref:Uncharacterized protein n=1 Tax=Austropuccinia psidii MF-1 TaxID=1389203 RepID=A0A9Q3KHJ8_9BASI|nr:hypothetical protein [Austropuccinia psidii MF-1]